MKRLYAVTAVLMLGVIGLISGCATLNPEVKTRTGVDPAVTIARMCKSGADLIDKVDAAYKEGRLDKDPQKNRRKALQALTAASDL